MKAIQLLIPERSRLPGVFGLSTGGDTYDQNGLMNVGRELLGWLCNQRCVATAARSENAEESHEDDTEHGPLLPHFLAFVLDFQPWLASI